MPPPDDPLRLLAALAGTSADARETLARHLEVVRELATLWEVPTEPGDSDPFSAAWPDDA